MAVAETSLSPRSLVFLLAAMTAAGPIAMNIYLPALPSVQVDFSAPVAEVNLTISMALVAFAAGILAYGPLSDHFGRRPAIIAGQLIFAAGNLLCLLAPSFPALLAGRIIQALGSSAGLVVARAMLGDIYGREQMARMLALLTMIMVIGPTVAPLIGGLATEAFGWQSVFALLLTANVLTLVLIWRLLPETRSAAALGQGATELARESLTMLRRPAFLRLTSQASVIFALFLGFISTAPYLLTASGRGAAAYGTWYLLLAGGYFLGNWIVTRQAARLGLQRLIATGLVLQFAGACAGAGFALGRWSNPVTLFAPMGLVSLGQGLALPNIIASAIALAPRAPGTASSLLGFSQQLAGAAAVQVMALFLADTPRPVYLFAVLLALTAGVLQLARPRLATGPTH